jgi:hypothetical protein
VKFTHRGAQKKSRQGNLTHQSTPPAKLTKSVWCCHCRRYHWHGYSAGHRAAHCADKTSPYYLSGYNLIDAGPASAELLRDSKRKPPRGPKSWEAGQ